MSTTATSVRIAWERRGAGAPLLLVHGLGYARWGWEPVADALARTHEVVLFDNRGIGESDAPPGPYTVGELTEDAIAVLDAAELERAHVLGTSLGGMVALELAVSSPDRVDKLVLACTTPGGAYAIPMPARTVELMQQAPGLPPEVALRRFVENALGREPNPEIVERIMEHRLATAQPLEAWSAQAAAGAAFDLWDRVDEIRVPTLVLTGDSDNVVDPRNSQLLAQRIPGARLEMFRGAGHLFFWEEPDRFVDLVTRFLDE